MQKWAICTWNRRCIKFWFKSISGHTKKLSKSRSILNEKYKKHFSRHLSYHSMEWPINIAKLANLYLKLPLYKILTCIHVWLHQKIKRIDVNIKWKVQEAFRQALVISFNGMADQHAIACRSKSSSRQPCHSEAPTEKKTRQLKQSFPNPKQKLTKRVTRCCLFAI